jgi:predicted acyltransferase (DUF342 family)
MQVTHNTQQSIKHIIQHGWLMLHVRTQCALLSVLLLLMSNLAFAITYNFSDSGVSPALAGCSRTGAGTYACTSAVTLTGNDSITISGTTPATITFSSNLTLQFLNETTSAKINPAGSASNLRLVVGGTLFLGKKTIVNANVQAGSVNDSGGDVQFGGSINTTTGSIAIGYSSDIVGLVTSTSGAINLGDQVTVGGSVTSTSGAINFTHKSTISGNVSCTTCTFSLSGLSSVINGTTTVGTLFDNSFANSPGTIYNNAITALTGDATIGYTAKVTGNITAKNNVYIRDGATVNGSIATSSTLSSSIFVQNNASVTGNITALSSSGVNLYLQTSTTINGDISLTSTGTLSTITLDVYDGTVVNGNLTANAAYNTNARYHINTEINGNTNLFGANWSRIVLDGSGVVVGDIRTTSNIADNAIVQINDFFFTDHIVYGNVYSNGYIYNYGQITQCAQTTSTSTTNDRIYLYSGSTTNATCRGTTSCSTNTGYLYTDWFVNIPPFCSIGATKIANYALDEPSWNGTANEVKDTAGYTGGPFNGQATGSPLPVPTSNNPARPGSNGTCGYAYFQNATNGSAFTLDSLPISTVIGEKTTVGFWMYWTGGDNVPMGWGNYNLWFGFGSFGFSTYNSDIYGISSSGLQNRWVHVVVVFTNGSVASNQLYIDGVKQTLTQRAGTPINSVAFVQTTLNVSGSGDPYYRFNNSYIDEITVYKGEVTQSQVSADYTATHSCPITNVVPSNFNCTVVGGASDTGRLYTQLVGTSFNVDVIALKSTGAVETGYVTSGTKNVTLEFVDGSGTTACASRAALSPAVSQTVTFSTADAGRKTVSANISRAYRDLRCRVTDANQSPSVVGCSSDDFAVRPASLGVSTSNANADATGANATAIPTIKTGASFNLTAASGVVGYDGTPLIDATKLSAHIGAVQLGILSGAFSAANSSTGIAVGNAFNYSEVGYFSVGANGVYDSSFTAVDSANGDCATGFTASGGKNACSFGNTTSTSYFGRFIPDHFAITAGVNTEGCDSGNFTYYGQDGLSTAFAIRAENSANAITQNYIGPYAKLGLNTWSNYNFFSQGSPYSPELSASATLPTGTWTNGSASVTAKHQISRLSAMVPQSPKCADEYNFCSFSGTRTVIYGLNGFYTSGTFTNGVSCSNDVFGDPIVGTVKACYLGNLPSPSTVFIFARPTDSDGVTMTSASVSTASLFRYGRLLMPNTYGSELLPLTVPIEAQYWNGSAYQRNQLDTCTAIPTSAVAMGNYKSNLSTCETALTGGGTMAAGKTAVRLSAPGNGNHGSVDLSLNLNSATGTTCTPASASATSAAIPWFGTSPSARATFGIFKSPVIYMRESY